MLTAKQIKLKYGISRTSLLEYEKKGLIHPKKTPKGHRRYMEDEIKMLTEKNNEQNWPLLMRIIREDYGLLPNQIKLIGSSGGLEDDGKFEDCLREDYDWDSLSHYVLGVYERVPVTYTGAQWIIHDKTLRLVMSQQIASNIYFKKNNQNQFLSTNIGERETLFDLPESGHIIFDNIINYLNERYKEHYYRTLRYFPDRKLIKVTNEIPLFILGEEMDELNNGIFPVVFRLSDY